MRITESVDDQLMVTAAHRYCLGRRSYIVGSCLDWIRDHWPQFTGQTKSVLMRDTVIAIYDGMAGDDIDSRGWKHLVRDCYTLLDDDERLWLKRAVSHRLELDDFIGSIDA